MAFDSDAYLLGCLFVSFLVSFVSFFFFVINCSCGLDR